jgi:serralysin
LVHYDESSWHERRDPSAAFSTNGYPDVAAAGINPLQHYLESRRAEGRSPLG